MYLRTYPPVGTPDVINGNLLVTGSVQANSTLISSNVAGDSRAVLANNTLTLSQGGTFPVTLSSDANTGILGVNSEVRLWTNPLFGSGVYVGSDTIPGAIADAGTVLLTKLNAFIQSDPIRNFPRCVYISAVAQPAVPYPNGTINVGIGASVPAYQTGSGNLPEYITGANQTNGCNINLLASGVAGARTFSFSFTNGSGRATTAGGVSYFWVVI
jgi:hypothetical protein